MKKKPIFFMIILVGLVVVIGLSIYNSRTLGNTLPVAGKDSVLDHEYYDDSNKDPEATDDTIVTETIRTIPGDWDNDKTEHEYIP